MVNAICKDCLIYHKFKDKCNVFWEGKKFCTMKVLTNQQWEEQKKITKTAGKK